MKILVKLRLLIAVVQSTGDERLYQHSGGIDCQRMSDWAELSQLKIAGPAQR